MRQARKPPLRGPASCAGHPHQSELRGAWSAGALIMFCHYNSCVSDLRDVCLAPADALFVQIECPLLTPERLASATASCTTSDPYHSMALSHSASATGVALSTGQLPQVTNSLEGSQAKQYPGVCKK